MKFVIIAVHTAWIGIWMKKRPGASSDNNFIFKKINEFWYIKDLKEECWKFNLSFPRKNTRIKSWTSHIWRFAIYFENQVATHWKKKLPKSLTLILYKIYSKLKGNESNNIFTFYFVFLVSSCFDTMCLNKIHFSAHL